MGHSTHRHKADARLILPKQQGERLPRRPLTRCFNLLDSLRAKQFNSLLLNTRFYTEAGAINNLACIFVFACSRQV